MPHSFFKNILTGTDFTDSSKGSVQEAIRLAVRFDATLHTLHVTSSDKGHDELRERIATWVNELNPPAELKLEPAVATGGISEGLAAYAEQQSIDLVAIGPKARTFVEKHLTGGPAEQLIRSTRRPTLITDQHWDKGYQHILVPVGLTEVSAQALHIAARLIEGSDKTLRLLHVLSGTGASKMAAHQGTKQLEGALKDQAREQVQHFLDETLTNTADINIEIDIQFGAISRWIIDVAEERKVDLVCIGTVGRKGLSAFFAGNTAGSLVRKLPCPMLVAYP